MKTEHIDRLVRAAAERRAAALVTDLKSGAQALFENGQLDPELSLTEGQLGAVHNALAEDRSGETEMDDRLLFIHVQTPPPRLIVIGAVHISQALVPMARLAG